MGCALHGPECDYRTHKCEKCGDQAVNLWFTLCSKHTGELRQERINKELQFIKELQERGVICNKEECEHENLIDTYCFDCGSESELIVCGSCKEWTTDFNPCC